MNVARIRDLCRSAAEAAQAGDLTSARRLSGEASKAAGTAPHHARAMALLTVAQIEAAAGAATAVWQGPLAAALSDARALVDEDFENAAVILERAALLHRDHGSAEQATELGRELIDWHARHLGADHPRYFLCRHSWGPPG